MISWDKSQLPKPTRDPDKVVNDIDRWGYGLLEDALREPLLTKIFKKIIPILHGLLHNSIIKIKN